MLRALVWKEWREQRPLIYAGVILAATMPLFLAAGLPLSGPRAEMTDLVGMIPVALGIFLWPILAAAAGASTISTDAGGATLGFLLSRPVSRTRLWLIKILVALFATGTVAALSLLIAQVCNTWLLHGQPDTSLGVLLRRASFGPFDVVALASLCLLLFACATFFSTLISRPLSAAAAGGALALFLLAGILMLWAAFSLTPRLEPQWLAAEVTLAAAIVLVASLAIFARAELLRRGSGWPPPALACVLALGLLGLVAIPAAHAGGRTSHDLITIPGDEIAVSGNGVAMTVNLPGGRGQEIWLVRGDGSGTSPITGRHTRLPTVTPNGREILYFSKRGLAGSVLENYDLRGVRPDGSGDRLIAAGLPGTGELFFSPYGRRAILVVDDVLYMISLSGHEVEIFDLSEQNLAGAELVGWSDSLNDEVIFVRREPAGQPGVGEMTLLAFGLQTGRTRQVFASRTYTAGYLQPRQPAFGWRYFPVPVAVEAGSGTVARIDLLELDSGELSTLGETSCFSGEFGRSSSVLTYVICAETADADADASIGTVATVRARNLNDNTEKMVSQINLGEGSITLIAGQVSDWREDVIWVLLEQVLAPSGETIAVVLGPEGHRLGMLPGWKPVGLSGAARVLLVDDLENIRTMASGDIRTGMLQVIYP